MKLYANKAEQYIKSPKGGAALIYGNDQGAVRDMAKQLVNSILPGADAMAIKEISGDELKDDEGLLDLEMNSVSFFAEKRIVKLIDAVDANLPAIMAVLEKPNPDVFLIVASDELKKDSKLRKFFEESKVFMALLCYKDDNFSVRKYVADKFREAGIRADQDALDFLSANLGEDKQITNNEIQKILLYLGEEKNLTFDDVAAIIADNSELTLTDVSFAVSSRDSAKLEKSLQRAFSEGVNSVPLLRAVSWHMQRVMTAKLMIANGMPADAAVKSLRPQVFFRQEELFKLSLRKWNENQLRRALMRLTETELNAKSGSIEPETICRHELLRLIAA